MILSFHIKCKLKINEHVDILIILITPVNSRSLDILEQIHFPSIKKYFAF